MNYSDFIILDGAMGTMIQAAGLPAGHAPEKWNIEHPEIIEAIQKQYVEAGSTIIYANTFGANRLKMKCDPKEIISAGVRAAKKAAGDKALVALDIGPIGQLIEPLGALSFDQAYDIFKQMIISGRDAGCDLIVFETMSDLYEVKAGVLAAKENSDLPIWVTMTFEKNSRTFVGTTIPSMALTLSALGVDAIGFNCSLGAKELIPMAEEASKWTTLPLILKPNAGLPDAESGKYNTTAEEFAAALSAAADIGVTIFGGCCGTSPQFISALSEKLSERVPIVRPSDTLSGVCSATGYVNTDTLSIIGERINPTGKRKLQDALKLGDFNYIVNCAIEQEDASCDILDVNVGLPEIDEEAAMKNAITSIQSLVNLPLMIDSSNPAVIETALRYYNGKPIVNSVNGNRDVLEKILPLCKKYGAAVVGLTMNDNGIPKSAEERIEIAEAILSAAQEYGIKKEDIYIDCLTLTVSAQSEQAQETLKAVRYVTEKMHLKTTLGVSNISFGLPKRETITSAFLSQALANGLTLPIINPNITAVMDIIACHRALIGEDKGCKEYIERFSGTEDAIPAPASQLTIGDAIFKGLKDDTRRLTKEALLSVSELDAVNTLLIPALDHVGDCYEKGTLFLPQLINSANAACAGFDVIKESIAQKGEQSISKGKIVLATVKGDIHDIGKNIVKVVLENYGYTIIDLGKDVPPEKVLETVISEEVRLVGLSALMTTTTKAMEETIHLVKENVPGCKIWVGGAVLTSDYAKKIGADFYAADAKESVDIAKLILG